MDDLYALSTPQSDTRPRNTKNLIHTTSALANQFLGSLVRLGLGAVIRRDPYQDPLWAETEGHF